MQTNTTPTLQHSTTPSSDDPSELQTELTTINTRVTELAGLSTTVKTLEDQPAQLATTPPPAPAPAGPSPPVKPPEAQPPEPPQDRGAARRSLLAPRQAPSA